MLKSILIVLSSLLVNHVSDNPAIRPKQDPGTQTGTLEKMIVANGSVRMDLDTDQLKGLPSKSRPETLRFEAAPNSFFTILVFNGELRAIEPGSMQVASQGDAPGNLPSRLKASHRQLTIERKDWHESVELVIRDEQTGFVFFNIEGYEYQYSANERLLTIENGRLLVSNEFAATLGRPQAAGSVAGTISFKANMKPIEVTRVVNGNTTSAELPPLGANMPGPDVIVGQVYDLTQFGSSGSQVGLAVATDSCNEGSVPLHWYALPDNDHPVIPQNLYRMSGGTGNSDRFEQIGHSWLKHAFTALTQNLCSTCQSPGTGSLLGVNCSDPYSASLNSGGASNNLGSRAWVNPFTGDFPRGDSATPPRNHTGHTHNGTSHRVVVNQSDLNTTLNPGATYFAEAQYVTPHEYTWCQANPGQCNMYNNVSYRQFSVTGTASPFAFSPIGSTVRMKPAVWAWTGATHNELQPFPGQDGLIYVSYKVTNPTPGVWHYEYAVYNQNLDRGIQSFSVPIAPGAVLTNVGFYAPAQHPAFANDGTVSSGGYSNTPWTPVQAADSMTWNTETFATNQNANAIRWGMMYNFRFDSTRPPQATNATVGFFKTGAPITVPVQGPSLPGLSINDVTLTEGNSGTTTANFTVSLSSASPDTVTVQYATADGTASAGSDYVSATDTITFAPSQTSQPVSITVNGDTLVEFNENFFVNLTSPTNATINDNQGSGTINNNDVSAALPAGFQETQVTGLSNATAMAVHPDGRVFVCQQTGELRVIKNGVLLATPFTTVTENSSGERGLLGIAFDPNYATNRFVYVYYTATTPTIHNRVSRFTADATNEDVAVVGSELVLLDLETLSATNHNGGAIHFGPDGKLYVAVGENAVPANSQSIANRLGKVLRINSDGTIPGDNPTSFPNIAGSPTGVNQSIWAVGLRNPFTFNFQPGTQRLHINDVGSSGAGRREEVNPGTAGGTTVGANYGWQTCEGTCGTAGMTNPIYQYTPSGECAITGGAFYNPTTPTFPAQYLGKYFFSDLCGGWMKTIDPLSPPPAGTAPSFATGINQPVDIQVANDGSLYYLARGSSSVFRIQYFGGSTLAINDVTVNEGNAGTSTANFTVTLSPASSQTVTVVYATANGTTNPATAGSDYVAVAGTLLTFNPGETSKQASVTINGDTTSEMDETFFVNLSSPANATIGDSQGLGTITNDDAITLSVSDASVIEGHAGTTTATFSVDLSAASSQTVTVNYVTANDSATAGSDYVAVSSTPLTFTPGQTSKQVTVTVNGDTTFEPNETFFVNLSGATNATIADGQGVGTINNDDLEPRISINDVAVTEGNSGTVAATFTVSLSNPSSQTITVNYTTADNTAANPGDYGSASGTVTFNPSQTSQPVAVNVNGDTTFESNETFNVNLSSPANATVTDSQGVGTINNDDAQPTISINDASAVTEGNSGTVAATFTVSLSNPSSQTITVNYATADNTATSPGDYGSASGTVTFNPNQTSQPVSVNVNGETMFEPNETFHVNLSGATNATIADNQGVGTINNDDSQPTISINDVSVTEGNSGITTTTLTVSLSNPSYQTITVNYATADNTATAGVDYLSTSGTVNIPSGGQTGPTGDLSVVGEVSTGANRTFFVNLSGATNATIADNQALVTIVDDDPPILATELSSQRAIALDAVTFVRDPFLVTNPNYFGSDKRTRVALFATNLTVTPGLVVTAQAVDSTMTTHPLVVENVSALPTFTGLAQIIVKLPDGITNAGDLQVTITVHGKTSNVVLIGVIPP